MAPTKAEHESAALAPTPGVLSATCIKTAYSVYLKVPEDDFEHDDGPSQATYKAAVDAIKAEQPELFNINPIFVFENLLNTLDKKAEKKREAGGAKDSTPESWIFFGFTATAPGVSPSGRPTNILCFRGTQTVAEALLTGWRGYKNDSLGYDITPYMFNNKPIGSVDTNMLNFYNKKQGDYTLTMAEKVRAAVRAVMSVSPNWPWLMTAHSLGAALLPLAMLDLLQNNIIASQAATQNITYGGLSIGNAKFGDSFMGLFGYFTRYVNLCDWVPVYTSLYNVSSTSPFAQFGRAYGFVWETGDFWGNHSMDNIYYKMMVDPNYSKLIKEVPAAKLFPLPIY